MHVHVHLLKFTCKHPFVYLGNSIACKMFSPWTLYCMRCVSLTVNLYNFLLCQYRPRLSSFVHSNSLHNNYSVCYCTPTVGYWTKSVSGPVLCISVCQFRFKTSILAIHPQNIYYPFCHTRFCFSTFIFQTRICCWRLNTSCSYTCFTKQKYTLWLLFLIFDDSLCRSNPRSNTLLTCLPRYVF